MIILTKDKRNNVNDYLNKIADITTGIIKSNINDLISIIISGGFGKGEGSAVVKQGKVIPINDFDVYIVTENEHSEEEINNIAQKAAKKIGKAGISSFVDFDKNRILPLDEFFYIDLKT